MKKNAKEVVVQWFVGCGNNQIPNESLAAALAEIGITDAEAKHPGMMGSDGLLHDVWQVPANFVHKLRAAKQSDARYTFRFFKRNGTSGPIYPGGFIEQPHRSKAFKEIQASLKKMQEAKAAGTQ